MEENQQTRLAKLMGGDRKGYRIAFQMAWPAVMESFFIALAGMVDSLMVSSMGAYAVAAVGLTMQPKFLGLCIFIATNVSVSALVARRKGEEDQKGANQVLLMALTFTLLVGTLISIICIAFADPIIRLCGANEDTQESSALYFRIIMGGMMFNIISMAINASQRGAGNTKIAMRTNVTSNVVNMIGNYLLIQGNCGFPKLGITGAALATVFGTVVACIMSILSLAQRDNFVSIPYIIRERVRITLEPAKNMAKIASSVFVEQVFMRIGFLTVSIMVARLGTAAYAAHQVGMNVMNLSFSFGDGMQVAAVALCGRSLGEKKPELAKMYGTVCQRIGNMISVVLAVLYLTCGSWYYHLFFVEPDIIAMGVQITKVLTIIVLLQIAQVIYMGCLRGAGDVLFTTIASTLSITIIRPIFSYLLCYAFGLGLVGIWLGIVCDQFSRFCLTTWRFKSGKWTKIKI
ncbi:MATE family efflux transporter [Lachnospiraceae bacterium 45-P1]